MCGVTKAVYSTQRSGAPLPPAFSYVMHDAPYPLPVVSNTSKTRNRKQTRVDGGPWFLFGKMWIYKDIFAHMLVINCTQQSCREGKGQAGRRGRGKVARRQHKPPNSREPKRNVIRSTRPLLWRMSFASSWVGIEIPFLCIFSGVGVLIPWCTTRWIHRDVRVR